MKINILKTNELSFYNDFGILTLNAKQFDTGRIFVFNIMDNDEPLDVSSCNNVYLRISKADGTQFQGQECCTINGSNITIDTSVGNGNQILTASGINKCELHLENPDGTTLTTWTFNIYVEKRVHDGSNISSIDSYDVIDNIVDMEKHRIENENNRIKNEEQRITGEEQRIQNENERKETFKNVLEEANESASSASKSATASSESAESSENYSNLSKSYAVGTENNIRENDMVDNAKAYSEQSKLYYDKSEECLSKVKSAEIEAIDKINDAIGLIESSFKVDIDTGHLLYTGGRFNFNVNKNNGHLEWEMIII